MARLDEGFDAGVDCGTAGDHQHPNRFHVPIPRLDPTSLSDDVSAGSAGPRPPRRHLRVGDTSKHRRVSAGSRARPAPGTDQPYPQAEGESPHETVSALKPISLPDIEWSETLSRRLAWRPIRRLRGGALRSHSGGTSVLCGLSVVSTARPAQNGRAARLAPPGTYPWAFNRLR